MAKLSDAVKAMCDLYLDICRKCPTMRVSKDVIAKRARELGIPNPELKRFSTGEVALLSDWVCDYLELTPEEWGGDYFADARLYEVHSIAVDGENH